MKSFSDKRQLKQVIKNPLKHNERELHPITLQLLKNNENKKVVLTQFWLNNKNDDFEITTLQNNKNLIKSRSDSENMEIPNLSLPLDNILSMYEIDNFNDLIDKIEFIKEPKTINRLINIFTRLEFDELKKINNSLIKIFKIVHKNVDDEFIKKFLKKWFLNKSKDDFFLNICEDFEKYIL